MRRNYGMVLQDTWLKNGTVRENINIGKPDASDEEIIRPQKKPTAGNSSADCQRNWIPY